MQTPIEPIDKLRVIARSEESGAARRLLRELRKLQVWQGELRDVPESKRVEQMLQQVLRKSLTSESETDFTTLEKMVRTFRVSLERELQAAFRAERQRRSGAVEQTEVERVEPQATADASMTIASAAMRYRFLQAIERRHGLRAAKAIEPAYAPPSSLYQADVLSNLGPLVAKAAELNGQSVSDALFEFGCCIAETNASEAPAMTLDETAFFDFLADPKRLVQVETSAIVADAYAEITRASVGIVIVYREVYPLRDFVHGLLQGCVDSYAPTARITRSDAPDELEPGESSVRFTIRVPTE